MKWLTILFISLIYCSISLCDFYAGMFQKNDLLVAQDRLYKERVPYRLQNAKYGRVFKCPITYLRVTDRLGNPRSLKTTIIRGGLRKKYVVLRISTYNRPISVNIYVGCDNKLKYTTRKTTTKAKVDKKSKDAGNKTDNNANASSSNGSAESKPDAEAGGNASDSAGAGGNESEATSAAGETNATPDSTTPETPSPDA